MPGVLAATQTAGNVLHEERALCLFEIRASGTLRACEDHFVGLSFLDRDSLEKLPKALFFILKKGT